MKGAGRFMLGATIGLAVGYALILLVSPSLARGNGTKPARPASSRPKEPAAV